MNSDGRAWPTAQRSAGITGWGLILIPGTIWGASFLFIAEGLEAVAPDGVTFLRFVFGFLTLSLVPAARRPIARHDRGKVALLGLVWLAFPMSMFPHAEQHVSSALTGMLNGATPLMAAAVSVIVHRRAPPRHVSLGLAIGFGGAVLMALAGVSEGSSSAKGVVLIVIALVSYGIALNLAQPLQLRNGALPVVWRALAVALIVTAPIGGPTLLSAHWSPAPLVAIAALGCLGTAVATVVQAKAAGLLGAARSSASGFLIPVVALLLGILVRGEEVRPVAIAGGALCLGGAYVMRRPPA